MSNAINSTTILLCIALPLSLCGAPCSLLCLMRLVGHKNKQLQTFTGSELPSTLVLLPGTSANNRWGCVGAHTSICFPLQAGRPDGSWGKGGRRSRCQPNKAG